MPKIVQKKINPYNLVIFGAKGNLSKKKLYPAIYQLEKMHLIHPKTKIIGVGRANWNSNFYREIFFVAIKKKIKNFLEFSVWNRLREKLIFCNLDIEETKNFKKLKEIIELNSFITISYFATPPETFSNICYGLAKFKMNKKENRIILEKPFGTDYSSVKKTNEKILRYFQEEQIYRIDHYLGKETVLNLFPLRFYNSFFYFNWNNISIDHIQITLAEKIGIEKRWNYFDRIGQMKDMFQSHMLQILTMISMKKPNSMNVFSIRKEKVKILKSLKKMDIKNARNLISLGQYSSGYIDKKRVLGYLQEANANQKSQTETFFAAKIEIENSNWFGVPFYLRTGKRMPKKCSKIVLYFRNPFKFLKQKNKFFEQNKITIRLQPDEGVDIDIFSKIPNLEKNNFYKKVKLNANFNRIFKTKKYCSNSYEKLLLEVMKGNQSLFVGREEMEESWKWIDSLSEVISKKEKFLQTYPSGTWGPKSSFKILKKDKRYWNNS
ncbi:glucose-6-phosphate dehydrogenase [bacterium endosymbiont of Pedicinus badii]|uniref:glucose-6-phosphate dehydrogenase n=1 Tax=bacterium endosymbiont of Pedicinus badii TaxID=1719126 RepID=UPI0009BBA646|nr:glucose-6-phosphate dehydrogenase [bacterium endosymbiont of Pedicinus badii]OQM34426.1 glucose-6-phosphate dehydrogenase [bacterium endosymbiont of Pedicinus badii]